eukprot:gene9825-6898_t
MLDFFLLLFVCLIVCLIVCLFFYQISNTKETEEEDAVWACHVNRLTDPTDIVRCTEATVE